MAHKRNTAGGPAQRNSDFGGHAAGMSSGFLGRHLEYTSAMARTSCAPMSRTDVREFTFQDFRDCDSISDTTRGTKYARLDLNLLAQELS